MSTRAHSEGQGGEALKAMLSTHHAGLVMSKTDVVPCLCGSCRPVYISGGLGSRDYMTKQRNKHKIAVCLQFHEGNKRVLWRRLSKGDLIEMTQSEETFLGRWQLNWDLKAQELATQREEEGIPGMGLSVLGGWSRVSFGKNHQSWRRLESQTWGAFRLGQECGLCSKHSEKPLESL